MLQDFEVFILGNNIFCIGNNGAIDKFVVIRVLMDKVEVKMRVVVQAIGIIQDSIYYSFCHNRVGNSPYYFPVFTDYLITDTKAIQPHLE